MNQLSNKQKALLCYLGLLVIFILVGNSNNIPELFIERIFESIRRSNWAIHYSGIIVVVGMYVCLKQLNNIRENTLIKTAFRRMIVMFILFKRIASLSPILSATREASVLGKTATCPNFSSGDQERSPGFKALPSRTVIFI